VSDLEKLVAILQLAYSGELAAAHAYRGHWQSVRDESESARIREIESEEWHHRDLVGEFLSQLGRRPSPARERRAWVIGRVLGALCHLTGRLLPMYGAGRLESRNIKEYEDAARYAARSDNAEMVDCLLAMAEVEWEHEHYFRSRVLVHRCARWIPMWPVPPPKEAIRTSFDSEFPLLRSGADEPASGAAPLLDRLGSRLGAG
jgi:demethoxyubiquinone hydroxylase (CLK1/Coq7/Cat5 family)